MHIRIGDDKVQLRVDGGSHNVTIHAPTDVVSCCFPDKALCIFSQGNVVVRKASSVIHVLFVHLDLSVRLLNPFSRATYGVDRVTLALAAAS